MNAGGLILSAILITVLIAVAVGATQMESNRNSEFAKLMQQRDQAVSIAQEAVSQRDVAARALREEKARTVADQEALRKRNSENQALAQDLAEAKMIVSQRESAINQAKDENAILRVRLDQLQAQHDRLVKAYSAANNRLGQQAIVPIPATGNNSNMDAACLATAGGLSKLLSTGLAILIGMVALSSGGMAFYHHDPNRKVTIKMTRKQAEEYARYQRGHDRRGML